MVRVSLTPGRAVLVGLGLLALLVVAYTFGHSRGTQLADATPGSQNGGGTNAPVTPESLGAVQPIPRAPNALQPRPTIPNVPVTVTAGQGGDPRQVGVNYFVLAHYPEKEARQLVQFLSSEGVETIAVRRNNTTLFQVLALKAFPSGTLGSPERREFQRTLQRLGQAWKQRHKGPTDLADMYPARYNGEPAAATITRETSDEPRP